MKKMKGILPALAAVLAASVLLVTGARAGGTVPENSVSLTSEKTDLETGDTVEVEVVSEREHAGTGAFELHISYDEEIFELLTDDCAAGDAVTGQKDLTLTTVTRDGASYLCITGLTDSLSASRSMKVKEGNIYTLTFKVKDDFEGETTTDITLAREVFDDASGVPVELADGADVSFRVNMIKYADYTAVDDAIASIPAGLDPYTDDSAAAVTTAVEAVVRDKQEEEQGEVDQMAAAIEAAVEALELRPAGELFSVKIDDMEITNISAVKGAHHTYDDEGAETGSYPLYTVSVPSGAETAEISFEGAVKAVNVNGETGEPISASINGGETVEPGTYYEAVIDAAPEGEGGTPGEKDGMPDHLRVSRAGEEGEEDIILYAVTFTYGADYTAVDEALAQVPEDLSGYTEESAAALTESVNAVERGLSSEHQEEVDQMAQNILDAIAALEERDQVVEFVTRLYRVCLDREPDEGGLNDWVSRLKSGKITGIKAAQGFIFSKEFKNKMYCDEHYVEYLYRAFMGREYDEAGKKSWVGLLAKGKTREAVFNGFANSKEFKGLCAQYGIVHGTKITVPESGFIPSEPCTICGKEDAVMAFVKRLYNVCLDRTPDQKGLSGKTTQLKTGKKTAKQIANSFYFSSEFKKKYPEDRDFIIRLYRGLLGRAKDPSASEVNNWLNRMKNGLTRNDVFDRFCSSNEFTKLCAKYGVTAR